MTAGSPARCRVVGAPVSYGLETFKDRVAALEQIVQWLGDPAIRVVTIFGRRGIGKSALAAKAVEMLADSDRTCRGIVNLRTRTEGPLTIERIFFACAELVRSAARARLNRLWASSREPRDKLAELFMALGQGTYVIVLDNIEDQLTDDGGPKNGDLEIFLDVVFRTTRAPRVLITTQVPVALDPAARRFETRMELREGLPVDACVELLRELDRDGEAGLLDASRAQLERTARRVYGVPRALELTVGALVGDRLTLPTLDEVLKDFTARGDIVDQLAHDRYQRLDDEAKMTLDVLAVFGSPVSREPVEWVMRPLAPGLDPARALSQLAHVRMVSVDRRSRVFELHPLDADIARSALPEDGPVSRRVLERRVAAWYERNRGSPPWRSITDVANQRRQYDHLLRAGDYDECALVLDEIGEFLIWQGSSREVIAMHLAIQDQVHDDIALLAHLVGYGHAREIGGPLAEAIQPLQRAVTLAERTGDKRQLERALFCLGDVFRDLRRLDEAVEVLRRAAATAQEIGNRLHQAHSLLQLSLALTYLGDVPAASEVADQLERLAGQPGEPLILAQASNARSAAYIVDDRWAEAITTGELAVQGYEASGVPEALGYARNAQAIALLGLGRVDEAMPLLDRARADGVEVQSPRTEGLSLYNLAWAHWMAGRHGAARDAARNAADAFRRSGGADVGASERLADAAAAMVSGDRQAARTALIQAARSSQGNTDLTPPKWLLVEAELLRDMPLD